MLKFGTGVLWMVVNKSSKWILKILSFPHYMGQKVSKIQYGRQIWPFWPIKWAKIKIFQIHEPNLLETILRTHVPNFSLFWWVVLSKLLFFVQHLRQNRRRFRIYLISFAEVPWQFLKLEPKVKIQKTKITCLTESNQRYE